MARDDSDDVTGLPDDLGIGDDLARSQQRLSIGLKERRYGRAVTIVKGFDASDGTDLFDLASTLKRRLATVGAVGDGRIRLQGDHTDRLPELLREEGFAVVGQGDPEAV